MSGVTYHYYKNSIKSLTDVLHEYQAEIGDDLTGILDDVAEFAAGELRSKNNGGKWKKYPRTWTWREQGALS